MSKLKTWVETSVCRPGEIPKPSSWIKGGSSWLWIWTLSPASNVISSKVLMSFISLAFFYLILSTSACTLFVECRIKEQGHYLLRLSVYLWFVSCYRDYWTCNIFRIEWKLFWNRFCRTSYPDIDTLNTVCLLFKWFRTNLAKVHSAEYRFDYKTQIMKSSPWVENLDQSQRVAPIELTLSCTLPDFQYLQVE